MKLNISRIFETSKILATEAGQQLSELVTYMADLSEQVLRALRNQLNFTDNFDCIVVDVSVSEGVDQVINTDNKQPVGVLVNRVYSDTYGVASFRWWIGEDSATRVNVKFDPTPSAALRIRLVILFS